MSRLQRALAQIQALLALLMGLVNQGAALRRQVDQMRRGRN